MVWNALAPLAWSPYSLRNYWRRDCCVSWKINIPNRWRPFPGSQGKESWKKHRLLELARWPQRWWAGLHYIKHKPKKNQNWKYLQHSSMLTQVLHIKSNENPINWTVLVSILFHFFKAVCFFFSCYFQINWKITDFHSWSSVMVPSIFKKKVHQMFRPELFSIVNAFCDKCNGL